MLAPEVSAYWVGWREASAAKVVMPAPARAEGMLGFSMPECSPVTTAAGLKLVSPLAVAKAWSWPISCSMEASGLVEVAGSQLPAALEQSMPGLVAVG